MNKYGNKTLDQCLIDTNLISVIQFLDPVVKIYIPSLIMVGLNVKVILRLRKSKQRLLAGQAADRRSNLKKFAVSTILIDLIFLILISPEAFFKIYFLFLTDNKYKFLIAGIIDIFNDFSLSYSGLLIFIFLIFNRLFRKELISFLSNILTHFSTRLNSLVRNRS